MKTNNLEEQIDEVFQKELYDFWGIEEELKESSVCYILDTIEKFILNREKALLTDIKSKIDKEIERWEKVNEESSSYKISALYDLRKKI